MKYQDKAVIVREGAEGDTFYIILKGEVTSLHIVWTHSLNQGVHIYCLYIYVPMCVFPPRYWWLRTWTGIRSRSDGWEKGSISGNRPLYGNHGNPCLRAFAKASCNAHRPVHFPPAVVISDIWVEKPSVNPLNVTICSELQQKFRKASRDTEKCVTAENLRQVFVSIQEE